MKSIKTSAFAVARMWKLWESKNITKHVEVLCFVIPLNGNGPSVVSVDGSISKMTIKPWIVTLWNRSGGDSNSFGRKNSSTKDFVSCPIQRQLPRHFPTLKQVSTIKMFRIRRSRSCLRLMENPILFFLSDRQHRGRFPATSHSRST